MFKYGSIKLFFTKLIIGLIILTLSMLIFISLISYDLSDPGFNKISDKSIITNSMGYFGALLSSILLVFIGHQSYTISFFLFLISIKFLMGIKSDKNFIKLISVFASIILINAFVSVFTLENYRVGILSLFVIGQFDTLYNSAIFPFV